MAGVWGTLIVPLSNGDASYGTQIIGIVAIGLFTMIGSGIVWMVLKAIIGIRIDQEGESMGMDMAEIGVEAYPEFATGGQRI